MKENDTKFTVDFTIDGDAGEAPSAELLKRHLCAALDRLSNDLREDLKYHIYRINVVGIEHGKAEKKHGKKA